MSDTKINSYLPITMPISSDDESKKSGHTMKKVFISTISPMPTRKALGCGKLIPAPERLTPTGQGRIKLPPVCIAPAMKKVASNDFDFTSLGVCFSLEEAELCAEKANLDTTGRDPASSEDDEEPLNIDKCLGVSCTTSYESMAEIATIIPPSKSEVTKCVSSSASIVSTSSCGRTAMRDAPTVVVTTTLVDAMKDDPPSTLLTNNLTKGNTSSRQGRSLQRWLVHSPSNELVRQVAGTIPITKDGRIILISASRKKEWILPKGGWDTDESKEECALRESFEEGGLVGKLGGRLEPIDYESGKSKKRAMKELTKELMTSGESGTEIKKAGSEEVEGQSTGQDHEESSRPSLPPCPKRFKTEFSSSPTGPELLLASVTRSKSSDSTSSSSSASDASCTTTELYYSYIRLNLFPLYVSSVESEWPEKGRLRKLVHIDEAIRIMGAENRPYFRMGLELVKERGLHLLMKYEQSQE